MKSVLITSSILILLLAALRPLLRGRIDPRLQYALWLILALRLLVPVELATSAYSALALLDRAEGPARAAQAIGQAHVPIPAMSYEDAFDQALNELQQEQTITTSFTDLDQVDSRAQELLKQGPTLAQLFEKYARPLWLGGAALAGLWFLLVNLRFRRRLRAAELAVIDPSTKLPVYVSDALLSPCLCGTFRPAIYITPHAVRDDRLRHVLAHESTHYRHKDHWWALVRCLCLCLYWFDPLVWWAAALSRQDCELACDAGAIRRLGEEERIPYGRTLVDMIAAGRCSLMQTATTMTGSKRRVRERVRLIARKPKTVIAVALALVLVLAAAVGCTFTGAPKDSQEPEAASSDNLQERLLNVPENLQSDVEARAEDGALAIYYFKKPSGAQDDENPYLLAVNQLSQEDFDQTINSFSLNHGTEPFAKNGSRYYVLNWSIAIEHAPEDHAQFDAAFEAIRAYAMEQVLATDGVEPFDPFTTPPHFFSNVPQPPLEPGSYAIDGMDYTLVTSYAQLPEDPEQWYLAGYLPGYPVWMFSRDNGRDTIFQVEDQLTQVFPSRSGFFSQVSAGGHAPRLMPLDGFGSGPNGTFGPVAVITHLFQGGTDQQYQLTVYDLGTDAVTPYVHDWKALMKDFNMNRVVTLDEARHSAIISYSGQTVKLEFDEAEWANIQQYGFSAETYEYCMNYYFNDDGTFDLAMPVNPFTTDQIAVWTLRFTGNGFETRPASFRFVQSDDVYTYISTAH